MRKLVFALLVTASAASAQATNPIGTLQPKTQTPPVLFSHVGDTLSESAWKRAPWDSVLVPVGTRFRCAKAGMGYALKSYNVVSKSKASPIYADTLVFACVAKDAPAARVSRPSELDRLGNESKAARRAEATETKPKKPPV